MGSGDPYPGTRRIALSPVGSLLVQRRALRELALAVARSRPLEIIYGLAATETAEVANVSSASVVRFDGPGAGEVVGGTGSPASRLGTIVRLDEDGPVASVARTGRSARADGRVPDRSARSNGDAPPAAVALPIRVDGGAWGALVATALADEPLAPDLEDRIAVFADLVGLAIEHATADAQLQADATTDPLTGLLNRRAFQSRLEAEHARALRYGRPLSLALLDLDHFKAINDTYGHDAGNEALVQVAHLLRGIARPSDLIARIGGDEFALLLPETGAAGARLVADRCRAAVEAAPVGVAARQTLSAGICDVERGTTHGLLLRLADDALYWAKSLGRDAVVVYTPEVVADLTEPERADRLQRSHAFIALQSLASAIDARDPSCRDHSTRVADLCRQLALAAAWSPERAGRLVDAALVHDIGKVAIPHAILLQAGPLDDAQLGVLRAHAELGAEIARDALPFEETTWIAQHHERPDGSGYPAGLHEGELSAGASLLSLADAWDVMTTGRIYQPALTVPEALAECRSNVGLQFTAAAVAALESVLANGEEAA
jgi:diguanylate cyclase (GGDEF)-like protein